MHPIFQILYITKMAQPPINSNHPEPQIDIKAAIFETEKDVTLSDNNEVDGEAEYALAAQKSYLNPRSKEAFQLYLIMLVVFLNATASGFDGGLLGSINAEPQYQDFFQLTEYGGNVGLIFILGNAASTIGCAFKSVSASLYLNSKWLYCRIWDRSAVQFQSSLLYIFLKSFSLDHMGKSHCLTLRETMNRPELSLALCIHNRMRERSMKSIFDD